MKFFGSRNPRALLIIRHFIYTECLARAGEPFKYLFRVIYVINVKRRKFSPACGKRIVEWRQFFEIRCR